MYYRNGLKIQKIIQLNTTLEGWRVHCTDLFVADTDAGEKDESELGNVEIRLRHERGQLSQDWG